MSNITKVAPIQDDDDDLADFADTDDDELEEPLVKEPLSSKGINKKGKKVVHGLLSKIKSVNTSNQIQNEAHIAAAIQMNETLKRQYTAKRRLNQRIAARDGKVAAPVKSPNYVKIPFSNNDKQNKKNKRETSKQNEKNSSHLLHLAQANHLEQQAIDIRKKSEISLQRSKSKQKEREQVADARVQERLALRRQKSIQSTASRSRKIKQMIALRQKISKMKNITKKNVPPPPPKPRSTPPTKPAKQQEEDLDDDDLADFASSEDELEDLSDFADENTTISNTKQKEQSDGNNTTNNTEQSDVNLNVNQDKSHQDDEEEKHKRKVKDIAPAIRLRAIKILGKDGWRNMSWKTRYAFLISLQTEPIDLTTPGTTTKKNNTKILPISSNTKSKPKRKRKKDQEEEEEEEEAVTFSNNKLHGKFSVYLDSNGRVWVIFDNQVIGKFGRYRAEDEIHLCLVYFDELSLTFNVKINGKIIYESQPFLRSEYKKPLGVFALLGGDVSVAAQNVQLESTSKLYNNRGAIDWDLKTKTSVIIHSKKNEGSLVARHVSKNIKERSFAKSATKIIKPKAIVELNSKDKKGRPVINGFSFRPSPTYENDSSEMLIGMDTLSKKAALGFVIPILATEASLGKSKLGICGCKCFICLFLIVSVIGGLLTGSILVSTSSTAMEEGKGIESITTPASTTSQDNVTAASNDGTTSTGTSSTDTTSSMTTTTTEIPSCTVGQDGTICQNYGTPIRKHGICGCDCTNIDYEGNNCEIKTICTTGPHNQSCASNGTATGTLVDGCTCKCDRYYEGILCANQTKCKNGPKKWGVALPCSEHGSAYGNEIDDGCTCICNVGYEGEYCKTNTMCENGPDGQSCITGTAKGLVATGCRCECSDERYQGTHCQIKKLCINELPCTNDGTITGTLVDGCTCTCSEHFKGTLCEIDIIKDSFLKTWNANLTAQLLISLTLNDVSTILTYCENNANQNYKVGQVRFLFIHYLKGAFIGIRQFSDVIKKQRAWKLVTRFSMNIFALHSSEWPVKEMMKMVATTLGEENVGLANPTDYKTGLQEVIRYAMEEIGTSPTLLGLVKINKEGLLHSNVQELQGLHGQLMYIFIHQFIGGLVRFLFSMTWTPIEYIFDVIGLAIRTAIFSIQSTITGRSVSMVPMDSTAIEEYVERIAGGAISGVAAAIEVSKTTSNKVITALHYVTIGKIISKSIVTGIFQMVIDVSKITGSIYLHQIVSRGVYISIQYQLNTFTSSVCTCTRSQVLLSSTSGIYESLAIASSSSSSSSSSQLSSPEFKTMVRSVTKAQVHGLSLVSAFTESTGNVNALVLLLQELLARMLSLLPMLLSVTSSSVIFVEEISHGFAQSVSKYIIHVYNFLTTIQIETIIRNAATSTVQGVGSMRVAGGFNGNSTTLDATQFITSMERCSKIWISSLTLFVDTDVSLSNQSNTVQTLMTTFTAASMEEIIALPSAQQGTNSELQKLVGAISRGSMNGASVILMDDTVSYYNLDVMISSTRHAIQQLMTQTITLSAARSSNGGGAWEVADSAAMVRQVTNGVIGSISSMSASTHLSTPTDVQNVLSKVVLPAVTACYNTFEASSRDTIIGLAVKSFVQDVETVASTSSLVSASSDLMGITAASVSEACVLLPIQELNAIQLQTVVETVYASALEAAEMSTIDTLTQTSIDLGSQFESVVNVIGQNDPVAMTKAAAAGMRKGLAATTTVELVTLVATFVDSLKALTDALAASTALSTAASSADLIDIAHVLTQEASIAADNFIATSATRVLNPQLLDSSLCARHENQMLYSEVQGTLSQGGAIVHSCAECEAKCAKVPDKCDAWEIDTVVVYTPLRTTCPEPWCGKCSGSSQWLSSSGNGVGSCVLHKFPNNYDLSTLVSRLGYEYPQQMIWGVRNKLCGIMNANQIRQSAQTGLNDQMTTNGNSNAFGGSCGDGIKQIGEECDNSNDINDADGCTSTCKVANNAACNGRTDCDKTNTVREVGRYKTSGFEVVPDVTLLNAGTVQIALTETWLIVGSPNVKKAFFYTYTNGVGSAWNTTATDEVSIDIPGFGGSVALTDKYAVVGTLEQLGKNIGGRAFVYTNINNGDWSTTPHIELDGSSAVSSSQSVNIGSICFSHSLSMTDNWIVVGAKGARQVFVFKNNGSTWATSPVQTLVEDDVDIFGHQIDLTDQWLAVAGGNYGSLIDGDTVWNSKGVIFMYENVDGIWIPKKWSDGLMAQTCSYTCLSTQLLDGIDPPYTEAQKVTGAVSWRGPLSLSNNYIMASTGKGQHDSNVYIMENVNGIWQSVPVARYESDYGAPVWGYFGAKPGSLHITDKWAVVGSWGGQMVALFHNRDGVWDASGSHTEIQARDKAWNAIRETDQNNFFGFTVAMNRDSLWVVGSVDTYHFSATKTFLGSYNPSSGAVCLVDGKCACIPTFEGDDCKYKIGGTCGDGELNKEEECDDGNDDNSDGCTSDCYTASTTSCPMNRNCITANTERDGKISTYVFDTLLKNEGEPMIVDTTNNKFKCGNPSDVHRRFKFQGSDATLEKCKAACEIDDACIALSGLFNTWCIGCDQELNTLALGNDVLPNSNGATEAPRRAGSLGGVVDDWSAGGALKENVLAKYGMIEDWSFGNNTRLDMIFYKKTTFNSDISKWIVNNIQRFDHMFLQAESFNIDLSSWEISAATTLDYMFSYAKMYNQILCGASWVAFSASKTSMFGDPNDPTSLTGSDAKIAETACIVTISSSPPSTTIAYKKSSDTTLTLSSWQENKILEFDTADFTLESWIYSTSTTPATQHIYSSQGSGGIWVNVVIHSGTRLRCVLKQGNEWHFVANDLDITMDQWVHVACTYSNNVVTAWVDGKIGTLPQSDGSYGSNFGGNYGGNKAIDVGYDNIKMQESQPSATAAGEVWFKPSTGMWYRSKAAELEVLAYDDPNMSFTNDWRGSPDWDPTNENLWVGFPHSSSTYTRKVYCYETNSVYEKIPSYSTSKPMCHYKVGSGNDWKNPYCLPGNDFYRCTGKHADPSIYTGNKFGVGKMNVHFATPIQMREYRGKGSGTHLTEIHYADGTEYQCNCEPSGGRNTCRTYCRRAGTAYQSHGGLYIEGSRRMTETELDTYFTKLVKKLVIFRQSGTSSARSIQIIAYGDPAFEAVDSPVLPPQIGNNARDYSTGSQFFPGKIRSFRATKGVSLYDPVKASSGGGVNVPKWLGECDVRGTDCLFNDTGHVEVTYADDSQPYCLDTNKTCVCKSGLEGDDCKYTNGGTCGDENLNMGEECDENTISCSTDCTSTSIAACNGNDTLTCDFNNTINSQPGLPESIGTGTLYPNSVLSNSELLLFGSMTGYYAATAIDPFNSNRFAIICFGQYNGNNSPKIVIGTIADDNSISYGEGFFASGNTLQTASNRENGIVTLQWDKVKRNRLVVSCHFNRVRYVVYTAIGSVVTQTSLTVLVIPNTAIGNPGQAYGHFDFSPTVAGRFLATHHGSSQMSLVDISDDGLSMTQASILTLRGLGFPTSGIVAKFFPDNGNKILVLCGYSTVLKIYIVTINVDDSMTLSSATSVSNKDVHATFTHFGQYATLLFGNDGGHSFFAFSSRGGGTTNSIVSLRIGNIAADETITVGDSVSIVSSGSTPKAQLTGALALNADNTRAIFSRWSGYHTVIADNSEYQIVSISGITPSLVGGPTKSPTGVDFWMLNSIGTTNKFLMTSSDGGTSTPNGTPFSKSIVSNFEILTTGLPLCFDTTKTCSCKPGFEGDECKWIPGCGNDALINGRNDCVRSNTAHTVATFKTSGYNTQAQELWQGQATSPQFAMNDNWAFVGYKALKKVFVYKRNVNGWSTTPNFEISHSDAAADDPTFEFYSIAMNDRVAVICLAIREESPTQCFVYSNTNDVWNTQPDYELDTTEGNTNNPYSGFSITGFGQTIDISENWLVIGAKYNGKAVIYKKDTSTGIFEYHDKKSLHFEFKYSPTSNYFPGCPQGCGWGQKCIQGHFSGIPYVCSNCLADTFSSCHSSETVCTSCPGAPFGSVKCDHSDASENIEHSDGCVRLGTTTSASFSRDGVSVTDRWLAITGVEKDGSQNDRIFGGINMYENVNDVWTTRPVLTAASTIGGSMNFLLGSVAITDNYMISASFKGEIFIRKCINGIWQQNPIKSYRTEVPNRGMDISMNDNFALTSSRTENKAYIIKNTDGVWGNMEELNQNTAESATHGFFAATKNSLYIGKSGAYVAGTKGMFVVPPIFGAVDSYDDTSDFVCLADGKCSCKPGFEGDGCKYTIGGTCGDFILNLGEECDDNTNSCSTDCNLISAESCGSYTCHLENTMYTQNIMVDDVVSVIHGPLGNSPGLDLRFASGGLSNTDTWAIVGDRVLYRTYIYKNVGGTWTLQTTLTPSTQDLHSQFGMIVGICDEGFAIVGSPALIPAHVYIYKLNGDLWNLHVDLVVGARPYAVAINGNFAVVQSTWDAFGINIYKCVDGTFDNVFDYFLPIDISRRGDNVFHLTLNHLIVGICGEQKAYIFTKSDTIDEEWKTDAIVPTVVLHETSTLKFGFSVGMNSEFAIVGGDTDKKVWVYKKNGNTWPLFQTITADQLDSSDLRKNQVACRFGSWIGITTKLLFIGGIYGTCGTGVYLYKKDDNGIWQSTYSLTQKLADRRESESMSLSENYIFVGQPSLHNTPTVIIIGTPSVQVDPICFQKNEQCLCKPGFEGKTCMCRSGIGCRSISPCDNTHTCVVENTANTQTGKTLCYDSESKCKCNSGFEGDNCQFPKNGFCGDNILNIHEECDNFIRSLSADEKVWEDTNSIDCNYNCKSMEKCASETICFSSGTVFDDDGNAQCYTTFTGTLKNCACKKGYVGNSCEYKSDGYCGDNVLNTNEECDDTTSTTCSNECMQISAAACDGTHTCVVKNTMNEGLSLSRNPLCRNTDKTCVCKSNASGNRCQHTKFNFQKSNCNTAAKYCEKDDSKLNYFPYTQLTQHMTYTALGDCFDHQHLGKHSEVGCIEYKGGLRSDLKSKYFSEGCLTSATCEERESNEIFRMDNLFDGSIGSTNNDNLLGCKSTTNGINDIYHNCVWRGAPPKDTEISAGGLFKDGKNIYGDDYGGSVYIKIRFQIPRKLSSIHIRPDGYTWAFGDFRIEVTPNKWETGYFEVAPNKYDGSGKINVPSYGTRLTDTTPNLLWLESDMFENIETDTMHGDQYRSNSFSSSYMNAEWSLECFKRSNSLDQLSMPDVFCHLVTSNVDAVQVHTGTCEDHGHHTVTREDFQKSRSTSKEPYDGTINENSDLWQYDQDRARHGCAVLAQLSGSKFHRNALKQNFPKEFRVSNTKNYDAWAYGCLLTTTGAGGSSYHSNLADYGDVPIPSCTDLINDKFRCVCRKTGSHVSFYGPKLRITGSERADTSDELQSGRYVSSGTFDETHGIVCYHTRGSTDEGIARTSGPNKDGRCRIITRDDRSNRLTEHVEFTFVTAITEILEGTTQNRLLIPSMVKIEILDATSAVVCSVGTTSSTSHYLTTSSCQLLQRDGTKLSRIGNLRFDFNNLPANTDNIKINTKAAYVLDNPFRSDAPSNNYEITLATLDSGHAIFCWQHFTPFGRLHCRVLLFFDKAKEFLIKEGAKGRADAQRQLARSGTYMTMTYTSLIVPDFIGYMGENLRDICSKSLTLSTEEQCMVSTAPLLNVYGRAILKLDARHSLLCLTENRGKGMRGNGWGWCGVLQLEADSATLTYSSFHKMTSSNDDVAINWQLKLMKDGTAVACFINEGTPVGFLASFGQTRKWELVCRAIVFDFTVPIKASNLLKVGKEYIVSVGRSEAGAYEGTPFKRSRFYSLTRVQDEIKICFRNPIHMIHRSDTELHRGRKSQGVSCKFLGIATDSIIMGRQEYVNNERDEGNGQVVKIPLDPAIAIREIRIGMPFHLWSGSSLDEIIIFEYNDVPVGLNFLSGGDLSGHSFSTQYHSSPTGSYAKPYHFASWYGLNHPVNGATGMVCAEQSNRAITKTVINNEVSVDVSTIKSVTCTVQGCEYWSGSYGDILPSTGIAYWDVQVGDLAIGNSCSQNFVFGIMLDSDVPAWKESCNSDSCNLGKKNENWFNRHRLKQVRFGYRGDGRGVVNGRAEGGHPVWGHNSNGFQGALTHSMVTHLKYDADAGTLSIGFIQDSCTDSRCDLDDDIRKRMEGSFCRYCNYIYNKDITRRPSKYEVVHKNIPAGVYRTASLGRYKIFTLRSHYSIVECNGEPCNNNPDAKKLYCGERGYIEESECQAATSDHCTNAGRSNCHNDGTWKDVAGQAVCLIDGKCSCKNEWEGDSCMTSISPCTGIASTVTMATVSSVSGGGVTWPKKIRVYEGQEINPKVGFIPLPGSARTFVNIPSYIEGLMYSIGTAAMQDLYRTGTWPKGDTGFTLQITVTNPGLIYIWSVNQLYTGYADTDGELLDPPDLPGWTKVISYQDCLDCEAAGTYLTSSCFRFSAPSSSSSAATTAGYIMIFSKQVEVGVIEIPMTYVFEGGVFSGPC